MAPHYTQRMKRLFGLAAVARKYAERYANLAQAQPIVRAIGGKAAARTIIRAGCLAGFQARGRP